MIALTPQTYLYFYQIFQAQTQNICLESSSYSYPCNWSCRKQNKNYFQT